MKKIALERGSIVDPGRFYIKLFISEATTGDVP